MKQLFHLPRFFLLALPILPVTGLLQAGDTPSDPRNIIVILVDDLGWADLGCYGSSFHDTPNLDALAAEGIRFTEAYAASPVCSPTRAALMTGKHPVRVDITDWIKGFVKENPPLLTPEDRDELALEEVTMAEILKGQGYTTGYFGKWHLGETEEYWPENQGFDVNYGGFSKGSPPGGYYAPWNNPRLENGPDGEYLTDRLTDEAIGFLHRNRESPFLLYLAFYTVHTPIEGCAKWDDHYADKREGLAYPDPDATRPEGPAKSRLHQSNAKYAAMVRSMDENVGRLMDELESLDLEDDTIVVFTSDNGGLSTQGGRIAPTSVLPLRAGKGWCYEGGIRVPLIIRAPERTTPGTVSAQPAISMDILPTILDLAGLPLQPERHLDGISLGSTIAQPDNIQQRSLVWHFPHYHASRWTPGTAMRVGDWKIIQRYESGTVELYNLRDDPGEQTNLAKGQAQVLKGMQTSLEAWHAAMGSGIPKAYGAGEN
ncbi:MAG: sulfatase [Puniceicoccaceae bacterium]